MTVLADAYLEAAMSVAELLATPAVGDAWHKASALADFNVSGLAGHLAGQVLSLPTVLAAPPTDDIRTVDIETADIETAGIETVSLEEHYGRVRWRGADPSAEVNVGIREGGEEQAKVGQGALVAQVRSAIEELRPMLADEEARRPVFIPWAGWAVTLDDFLTSRMMEIAVHSDDLAYSVGIETPMLSVKVMHPVYDLLFKLALRRHGHTAVLRALSRAERAPASIAAI